VKIKILIYISAIQGGVFNEKDLSAKKKAEKQGTWIFKKNEYKIRKKYFKEKKGKR
jgi:hypothetical protein